MPCLFFEKMAANLNNSIMFDSDDEDFWLILDAYVDLELTRRPRTMRDRSNPLSDFDDIDFRMRFRLPKAAAIALPYSTVFKTRTLR